MSYDLSDLLNEPEEWVSNYDPVREKQREIQRKEERQRKVQSLLDRYPTIQTVKTVGGGERKGKRKRESSKIVSMYSFSPHLTSVRPSTEGKFYHRFGTLYTLQNDTVENQNKDLTSPLMWPIERMGDYYRELLESQEINKSVSLSYFAQKIHLLNQHLEDTKGLRDQQQRLTPSQKAQLNRVDKAWQHIKAVASGRISDELLLDWINIVSDFVHTLASKNTTMGFEDAIRKIHRRVLRNYLSLCQLLERSETECITSDEYDLARRILDQK
jgi:hypothetical protein